MSRRTDKRSTRVQDAMVCTRDLVFFFFNSPGSLTRGSSCTLAVIAVTNDGKCGPSPAMTRSCEGGAQWGFEKGGGLLERIQKESLEVNCGPLGGPATIVYFVRVGEKKRIVKEYRETPARPGMVASPGKGKISINRTWVNSKMHGGARSTFSARFNPHRPLRGPL
jgi:hypothetical protein